jgi:ketosteroid isomerase-like protein
VAAPVPAPPKTGTGPGILHAARAALLPCIVLVAACTRNDPQLAALQQRVQQLEDQEAVRQVLVAYGERLDARDFAGYAALFAREGIWTGGFGTFTGPAAIQAMLEKNIGAPEPGFINKSSFHLMTTMVVEVRGDTATARSRYLFFTATPEDRPGAAIAGRYIDEFVREDGQWKILRRTTLGVIPWRDGSQSP